MFGQQGEKTDNEIVNAAQKTLIWPQTAKWTCGAIDGQEKTELIRCILNEYNERFLNQQWQQVFVQPFLREYYNRKMI